MACRAVFASSCVLGFFWGFFAFTVNEISIVVREMSARLFDKIIISKCFLFIVAGVTAAVPAPPSGAVFQSVPHRQR